MFKSMTYLSRTLALLIPLLLQVIAGSLKRTTKLFILFVKAFTNWQ